MTQKPTRPFVSRRALLALAALFVVTSAAPARAVTIPTVPVGNLGNATDPLTGNLYGSVSYAYNVGTTEVTNAQYAAFLNAKAAADPLGLYNTSMGSDARGGISRSGVSGSFTYTTIVLALCGALSLLAVAHARARAAAVIGGVLLASATSAHAASFTFQGLGDLAGGETWSIAAGVSADGMVVVGSSGSTNGREAVRWTSGGGLVGLGDLPGGVYSSRGAAISGDGNVITGWSASGTGRQVIRWTQATGMVGLGDVSGGTTDGFGQGINFDGSVIVGQGESASGTEAFRWTDGGGIQTPLFASTPGSAFGTNDSGSLTAGQITYIDNSNGAILWESNVGSFQPPSVLFGGDAVLRAVRGTTHLDAVAVGSSDTIFGVQSIRWTSGSPMYVLGDLLGGAVDSEALALSSDGAVIVGRGTSAVGSEAFLWWNPLLGMVNLRDYLLAHGAGGLSNWTLTAATGISADGHTIVGYGTNPNGFTEAWIATIPEPSSFVLAGIGLALAMLLKPRRRLASGFVLAMAATLLSVDARAETIGLPLIDRPSEVVSAGLVFVFDTPFSESGTVSTWAYFDNDDFEPDRSVTPLIFERTGNVTYTLRGVGTPRASTGIGFQSNLDFGLIAGSDQIIAGTYTFGFANADLLFSSVSDQLVVNSTNAGVIDSDYIGDLIAISGPTPPNLGRFVQGRGASTLQIGSSFGIRDDNNPSTIDVVQGDIREFSAQMSVVPEPSTFVLAGFGTVGLLFIAIRGKSGSILEKWLTCSTSIRRFASRRLIAGSLLPLFFAVLVSRPADGAYVFTNVADTTNAAPTFIAFPLPGPAVSENRAAFFGLGSATGIYTGSGGPLTKIVKTGDAAPIGTFGGIGTPAISGSTAAFRGNYQAGTGIFTGSGGSLTAIAKTGDAAPVGSFDGFSNPAIHDTTAAFRATYDSGAGQGIFAGSGGPLTTIATTSDAAPVGTFNSFGTLVAISGTMTAFSGSYSDGVTTGSGIFTSSGGPLTTIVKSGDAAPVGTFGGFGPPSLSGTTAAFSGSYSDGVTSGSGIFTSSGGPLTTIVKSGDAAPIGTFDSFLFPSLGGTTVAFVGQYNGFANEAIFTGNGEALNYVIGTGDSLFGSTVADLFVGPFGADEGSLAFRYALADGRAGIAIATVPEPSTMVLAACGAVGLLLLRSPGRRLTPCHRRIGRMLVYGWLSLSGLPTAQAVVIPTVPVGNAGNAADPFTGNLYGSVSYDYRIGTTEVTNAQYAEFLNAKAASDPLGLYSTSMGNDARGGIMRSGVSGSFTYTTKPNMGDKPVNYVSWYDSIRFANWLNNGQGTGDTETGAYTLLGGTPIPSNGLSITRHASATWFLTNQDEWYKAAYHQPSAQGGDSDDYWLYPTASNTAPTIATADSVGNISNPGVSVANYLQGADWNSQNGNVTTVGSAGPLSASYYGTADQGGNVWEWNEALNGSFRGLRGSGFIDGSSFMRSSNGLYVDPNENVSIGFRVATVPEPSAALLGLIGFALVLWWRKRRK